jgi:predicted TIM-barrel fold metal-dependent hydrolase
MEWVGWDRIMFSTDYPHWDYDDPAQVLARLKLTAKQKAMLLGDNARALYGLA